MLLHNLPSKFFTSKLVTRTRETSDLEALCQVAVEHLESLRLFKNQNAVQEIKEKWRSQAQHKLYRNAVGLDGISCMISFTEKELAILHSVTVENPQKNKMLKEDGGKSLQH